MRSLTEHELLCLAQAGERAAFDLLIAPHIDRLRRQLRRHARSPADADDILQELLLRVWLKLSGFRGEARLATWLYRIAHNALLTFYARREPTFVSADADDEPEGASAPELVDLDTPESTLDARQEYERLVRELHALPAVFARALYLRELKGLTYEEIAAHQGVPVGTVRSRLNRARKGLGLKQG